MLPAVRKTTFGRILPRLVWTSVLLTTFAGAVVGVGVTVATNHPPQEIAAMALAYLLVVTPYVFVARAMNDLGR